MIDIDGTLIFRGYTRFSKAVANALRPFIEEHRLIVNSARHPHSISRLFENSSVAVPTIALNGSVLCATQWSRADATVSFSRDGVFDIYRHALSMDITLSLFAWDNWYVTKCDHFVANEARATGMTPSVVTDPSRHTYFKLTAMAAGHRLSRLATQLSAIHGVSSSLSHPDYLEITPSGVTKATLIPKALVLLGHKRNCVQLHFLGDSYNDIPCAEYADIASTFKSAPLALRQACNSDYLSRSDVAVASYLRKLWLSWMRRV